MSSSQSDVCLSLLHSHMQTVSTYMSEHIHTQTVHTCECAQTQIAYTCCANIQECTHTLTRTHTHKYIHTLTLTKLHMLTHTHTTLLNHVNVHCHLWKTNSCVPSLPPPCPAIAQLPHMPGALTDVAVSSSVAAASPVPASVSRVCRAVSTLQSNNESCKTANDCVKLH